jgi:hypothetical protein
MMTSTPRRFPDPFGGDLTDFDFIATLLSGRTSDEVATDAIPKRGMFSLHATNSKKRGKANYTRTLDCEGTLFSSGRVVLDTYELAVSSFQSMGQMEAYLSGWGEYTLDWIGVGEKHE